jgi:hypothetical protein
MNARTLLAAPAPVRRGSDDCAETADEVAWVDDVDYRLEDPALDEEDDDVLGDESTTTRWRFSMNKVTFAMGLMMTMVVPAGCSSAAPAPAGTDPTSDPGKGTSPATGSPSATASTPPPGGAVGSDAGSADSGITVSDGGSGACTNPADEAVASAAGFMDSASNCAQSNFGQEPGTKSCIKALGLSDACTTCFDDNISCIVTNCLGECSSDSASADCVACRAKSCDPAFLGCSGFKAQ